MAIQPVHKASCHCGSVKFEVLLPNGLSNLSRCNCSMCRRRSAIVVSVPLEALRVTEGELALSLYQFNTKTAKHYFCPVCGIYTHHQMRSNPNAYDFNVACLEGIDLFEPGEVPTYDGKHHPADK